MPKRFLAFILISYVSICISGCSSKAWYEGFREERRRNCYKIESPNERQKCLKEVDEKSYDQYQKEREMSEKQ